MPNASLSFGTIVSSLWMMNKNSGKISGWVFQDFGLVFQDFYPCSCFHWGQWLSNWPFPIPKFRILNSLMIFVNFSCTVAQAFNTVFSKIDFWFECKNIVIQKLKWNKLSLGMDGSVLKSTSPSKLLLIDNILRFGWSLRKSYNGFLTEPNWNMLDSMRSRPSS